MDVKNVFQKIKKFFICRQDDDVIKACKETSTESMNQKLIVCSVEEYAENLKKQAIDLIPDDLSEEQKKYVLDTVYKNSSLSFKTLLEYVNLELSIDMIAYITQILAEWTFHKCVDLSRSEIPMEYWDEIIRKIAYVIYEIAKNDVKKEVKNEILLNDVEEGVVRVWKKEIDDLVSQNKLSKEAGNKTKQLSNIDDMAKREG